MPPVRGPKFKLTHYLWEGFTYRRIARIYRIAPHCIEYIDKGRNWKGVPRPSVPKKPRMKIGRGKSRKLDGPQ